MSDSERKQDTPDTDRTHTPLPFESRLVMNQMDNQGSTICAFGGYQDSPRWMMFSPHMPGDTEADAKFVELAVNSHYKLLELLESLLLRIDIEPVDAIFPNSAMREPIRAAIADASK